MCRYATSYKPHFVCLACRASFKQSPLPLREHPCPHCRTPMVDAGFDLAVPRRGNNSAWKALEATLRAGLTFHSCGCDGPGYRPRSTAEVRERRRAAKRLGLLELTALERYDPWEEPAR
ncbi:deoxyxylulose-5-phosphate synthase [Streptomyces sp. NPDC021080]|uniref:deoxyxylulose-5-phosphate synthase n=1 Tax=Streptomyces sp. NPDC021080 TaxID=3365110 RepID=UPI0037BB8C4C